MVEGCGMNNKQLNGIPLEAQYLYLKAHDLAARGRYGQAFECFRQAVTIAPKYCNAIYEMGECLVRLGRPCEAAHKFDQVLRIDPCNAGARSWREILQEKTRETPQADESFFVPTAHTVDEIRVNGRTLGELIRNARRIQV
jgi:tetratricopeptide (TPR) repeat protein